jgi:hypothetical protein
MSPYALSGWCQSLWFILLYQSFILTKCLFCICTQGGRASKRTPSTGILLRIRMLVLTSGVVSS